MKLGSASVRRCRLRLNFADACPEKTSEFPDGGVGFGGVGLELRRLYQIFILSSVWSGESWADLDKLGDNQDETCLIITINDTSIGDLPLIITISDTCKNQPKRLDSDNTINLSSLIVSLALNSGHDVSE
jgi:hypothetical protein